MPRPCVLTCWLVGAFVLGCSVAPDAPLQGSDNFGTGSQTQGDSGTQSEAETSTEKPSTDQGRPLAEALCPGPQERSGPVVIEGSQLKELLGQKPAALRAMRFDGSQLASVVLQVDERVVIDWPTPQTMYVVPEDNSFELVAKDDDPTFDANDELVLSPRSFGARWPKANQAPSSVWLEVHALDPLDGAQGWLYLTVDDSMPVSVDDVEVEHERKTCTSAPTAIGERCIGKLAPFLEHTSVTTPCYQVHFDKNFAMDAFVIKTAAGGKDLDIIDRWKGRAFAIGPSAPFGPGATHEHEDLVDEAKQENGTQAFCGWSRTDNNHYYAGHKSGPLRVIRMVRGACSYSNMVRTWVFSRDQVEEEILLRGHAVPRRWGGVGFYWDYDRTAAPLEYRSSLLDTTRSFDGEPEVDGVNVRLITDQEMSDGYWEATSGPLGGIASFVRVRVWPAGAFEFNLYLNDNVDYKDGTGDDPGVWGGQGLRLSVVPATDKDPAILSQIWRPFPADLHEGAAAWRETLATAVQVEVSQ